MEYVLIVPIYVLIVPLEYALHYLQSNVRLC